jgi:hypothetical protein
MTRYAAWGFVLLGSALNLSAGIVSEALFSFPANTDYVEYDNLAKLRTLPDYPDLRKRFAGPILEQTQTVLEQLGVQEQQVQQIVTGAHSADYFGLLTGTFSRNAIEKTTKAKRLIRKIEGGGDAYGGRTGVCVLFLEDSLAAFGSPDSLQRIRDARAGTVLRLTADRNAVNLLSDAPSEAPIRGLLLKEQVQSAIADLFSQIGAPKANWSQVAAKIEVIGYSIDLDRKAHLRATVECDSHASAMALSGVFNAIRGVNSLLPSVMSAAAGTSFQILQSSGSGKNVSLVAEAALP